MIEGRTEAQLGRATGNTTRRALLFWAGSGIDDIWC